MPDQSNSIGEKALLALGFAGIVLFSAALLNEQWFLSFYENQTEGDAIGSFTTANNDIRRRRGRSLTWYNSQAGDSIFDKDSIFTGPDSEAYLEVKGLRKLHLSSNTLVVVQALGDQVTIDLKLGEVSADIDTNQKLKIVEDGKTTEVQGPTANLKLRRESTGKIKVIDPSRPAKVEVTKVSPPILISPKNQSHLYQTEVLAAEEIRKVPFIWKKLGPKDKFNLQIAKNQDFSELIVSEPAAPDRIESDLGSGTYYWRLAHQNPEFNSEEFQFKVGGDAPTPTPRPPTLAGAPNPLTPKSLAILKFNSAVDTRSPASILENLENPPKLMWAKVENAKSYDLQISKEKEFLRPNVIPDLKENSYTWSAATPGKFYWRVIAKAGEGVDPITSEPAELNVRLTPPAIEPPELATETVTNVSQMAAPKPVSLNWPSIPYAAKYKVKIDGVAQTIAEPNLETAITPNQPVKILVAATNEAGREISSYTEVKLNQQRNLMVEVPQTKFPLAGSTVVALGDKSSGGLVFGWAKVKDAEVYELEFSKDPEFTEVSYRETLRGNSFVLKKSIGAGLNYWRVRARVNNYFSSWSKESSFTLQ